MSILLAASVAVLGPIIGIAHSVIGERSFLMPLDKEAHQGVLASREKRAILRAVWHLPSLAWALLGVAVFAARLQGGIALISLVAAVLFALSGIANLVALRRPFIGGLLLTAALLTLADYVHG